MSVRLPHPRTRDGAGLALLTGILAVVGSFATVGHSSAWVVVPVDAWEVNHMPAIVLRFAIVVMGELGDYAGLALAIALTVALFSAVAAVAVWVGARRDAASGVAVVYGLGWGLATLLTRAPWASLGVAAAMVAVLALSAVARQRTTERPVSAGRRNALRVIGGLAAIGAGYVIGNRGPIGLPPELSTVGVHDEENIKSLLDEADGKSLSVGDLNGLVSTIPDFYEVDIDSVNPGVKADEWSLSVTGDVDTEVTVSYDDLTGMPPEERFKTLRCVGEPLNGYKLDNALWTGVPASEVLSKADVHDDATHVVLHAVDGYFEEFPLDAMQNGFLAYGMNGRVLPKRHGHPVRALLPGRWGEVNVKWLSTIEVIAGEETGYWERRNWKGTGPVSTVATLHAIEHRDGGRIRVGGHAYAGTRGVDHVQVSTDGGSTWDGATLSAPLPGDDVWRMWAYEYPSPGAAHEVVVRAVDGTGALQTRTNSASFPSGATGWVRRRISP